jgi:hypothetical protein
LAASHRLAIDSWRDYNLSQQEAMMPKKKLTDMETATDWEIVEDVLVHRPLGIVLSVRFDPSTVDRILGAAESLGVSVTELAKRAVLLAATDPAFRERIAQSESQSPITDAIPD